jgi:hypothetical protein
MFNLRTISKYVTSFLVVVEEREVVYVVMGFWMGLVDDNGSDWCGHLVVELDCPKGGGVDLQTFTSKRGSQIQYLSCCTVAWKAMVWALGYDACEMNPLPPSSLLLSKPTLGRRANLTWIYFKTSRARTGQIELGSTKGQAVINLFHRQVKKRLFGAS